MAWSADEGRLTPRIVIPVDLFGLPADYEAINAIARREGLKVLADAAQAFGAAQGNRRVGVLADVTATSFFPAKPLGLLGRRRRDLYRRSGARRDAALDPHSRPRRRTANTTTCGSAPMPGSTRCRRWC